MVQAQILGATGFVITVLAGVPFLGMLAVSGQDPDWDWHARFLRLFVVLIVMAFAADGAAIVMLIRS